MNILLAIVFILMSASYIVDEGSPARKWLAIASLATSIVYVLWLVADLLHDWAYGE